MTGLTSELFDSIKTLLHSTQFAFFGAIASTSFLALLLITPNSVGLTDTPSVWKSVIFIISILSWPALIVQLLTLCVHKWKANKVERELETALLMEFPRLSLQEATALFYAHQSRETVVTLPINSPVSISLRRRNFIYATAGPTNPLATHFSINSFVLAQLEEYHKQASEDIESWAVIEQSMRDYRDYIQGPVYHYTEW